MVETLYPRSINAGIRRTRRVVLPFPLHPEIPMTFMIRLPKEDVSRDFFHHMLKSEAEVVIASPDSKGAREPEQHLTDNNCIKLAGNSGTLSCYRG